MLVVTLKPSVLIGKIKNVPIIKSTQLMSATMKKIQQIRDACS